MEGSSQSVEHAQNGLASGEETGDDDSSECENEKEKPESIGVACIVKAGGGRPRQCLSSIMTHGDCHIHHRPTPHHPSQH